MKQRLLACLLIFFSVQLWSQSAALKAVYSGSTTTTTKTAGDLDNIGDVASRGFIKFDMSSLPSNAVITSASLQYYNYACVGLSGVINGIYALSNDPVTTSAATLYTDCGDAAPISNSLANLAWVSSFPVSYNTSISNVGITYLNSRIGTNAGIGIARGTGGSNTYSFRGYLDTVNLPKLLLNYYVPVPCAGVPTTGSVQATKLYPCNGDTVKFSLLGSSLNANLGYQWQQLSSGGSWANITGAINNNFDIAVFSSFHIRCVVKCLNTNDSAISDSVSIHAGGITNFPYHENFEASNGGWRGVDLGGGNQEWLWGTPSKTITNGAINGQYCWSTNLNSDYTDLMDYALESPCLNLTNVAVPRMSFSMRYLTEVDYDGLFLETSDNGGATWTKVPSSNIILNTYNSFSTIAIFTPPAWCGDNGSWLRYVVSLPNLGGVSNAKVRVRFQSDNFVTDEGVAFDSVTIANTTKDLTVTELLSPVNSCSPPGNATVKAVITNVGLSLASGSKIPVSFKMNNGSIHTDTIQIASNKQIGDTIQFTFTSTTPMTTFGNYNFKVWVSLPGDSDASNDTLYKMVSILSVSSYPYRENFEINDGGWTSKIITGTANDFMWAIPSKTFISAAASGTKCWVTRPISDYDNNSDYALESPCINLSIAFSPTLSFSLKFSTEPDYDGCILESTTNGGLSWNKVTGFTAGGYNNTSTLGMFAPPQWSGNSAGWQRVKVPLASFAGQSNVKFRLHFASDFVTSGEGVAIDSIGITDIFSKDVGVAGITSALGGCGLTSTTPLTVKVKNYGKVLTTGTKIKMGFRMVDFNNILVSAGTDSFTLSSNFNINDSLSFTFNSKLNLATPGFYIVKAWTALANDSDQLNDTLFNFPILSRASVNTYPNYEDFEITDGAWYSEPLNGTSINDWGWNFPVKPVINATPNGQQCWLTNPFSNYASNTDNAFYSPCFDFAALTNPEISFIMRFKTQVNNDGMVLERSINGGASWQRVDSLNTQATYNNTSAIGSLTPPKWSGDNGAWKRYTINVSNLASQSNVQFRFHFKSDAATNDEGAAIDSFVARDNIFNDLSLVNILAPISKCGLSVNEKVQIIIRNQGNVIVPSGTIISLGYQINGGAPVNENYTLTADLAVNGTLDYSFTATANLNLGGSYSFSIYCNYWADIDLTNDTISNYLVTTKGVVSTYPYNESFLTNTSNWTVDGGNNEKWIITDTILNPATASHSANYMAVFNAGSFANKAASRLISPCFDFSTLDVHATLSFYLTQNNLNASKADSLNVLVSNDDGATWVKVKSLSRYQASSPSNQWNRIDVDLAAYANQPLILIAFEAIGHQGNSIGIDDISLYNTEIRSADGIFSATAPCPLVSGVQWIDLRDERNNLIAQINPNGNSLGTLCFGLNSVRNKLRYERTGLYPNRNDNYYFVRNLWLQSSTAPTTPVDIRLYYLPADFDLTRDSIFKRTNFTISKTDLKVLNYSNTISPDDLDVLNNDYTTGTATYSSQADILANNFNFFYFTTAKLGELSLVYRPQVTGITSQQQVSTFVIYPNPADGKLNVTLDNMDAQSTYIIYNTLGAIVLEGALPALNNSINIQNLSAGMYLIKVGNMIKRFEKK